MQRLLCTYINTHLSPLEISKSQPFTVTAFRLGAAHMYFVWVDFTVFDTCFWIIKQISSLWSFKPILICEVSIWFFSFCFILLWILVYFLRNFRDGSDEFFPRRFDAEITERLYFSSYGETQANFLIHLIYIYIFKTISSGLIWIYCSSSTELIFGSAIFLLKFHLFRVLERITRTSLASDSSYFSFKITEFLAFSIKLVIYLG